MTPFLEPKLKCFLAAVSLLLFCGNTSAQDTLKAEIYEEILNDNFGIYNDEMYSYMDSLTLQGGKYVWNSKLFRASAYSRNSDSLKPAELLINACIEHYKQVKDTNLLAQSIKLSYFINLDLSQFLKAIDRLNQGVALVATTDDFRKAAFFEGQLGYLYLSVLEDTLNALPHIKNGISTALKVEAWDLAKLGASHLLEYNLLVGDTTSARNASELALKYSTKYGPLEARHYEGHNAIAHFLFRIGEPENAIEHGITLVTKGRELENKRLLMVGVIILAQAYFETGNLKQAHKYVQVGLKESESYGQANILEAQDYWNWQIYDALGMTEKALASLKRYNEYRDAYNDESSKVSITKTLFQGELKRKEIEKEKVELSLSLAKEKSKAQSSVIISVIGLLLALGFYVVLLYRKKKKEVQLNRILTASNEVVIKQKEYLQMNIEELQQNLEEKTLETDSYYFTQSAIQIKFEDVVMLESSNNYVLIYVVDRKNPLLERVKMIELIKGFPSSIFVKIHRSYYVNVNHIISRSSKYDIKMSNEVLLTSSRNFVDNLGGKFLN